MKYCRNCGTNVEGMKFCPNCGNAVIETETTEQDYSEIQVQNNPVADTPNIKEKPFFKQPAFVLAIAIPVILVIVFVIAAQIPSGSTGTGDLPVSNSESVMGNEISEEEPILQGISATYDGETAMGTKIDIDNNIEVTGYYSDGTTMEIDTAYCTIKNPGILERGVTSTFEVEYEGFITTFSVTGTGRHFDDEYVIDMARSVARQQGNFKSPDSLQFKDEEVIATDDYGRCIVRMKINGKNSFGGYSGYEQYYIKFLISMDGESFWYNWLSVLKNSFVVLNGEEDFAEYWNGASSDDDKWGEVPPYEGFQ